MFGSHTWRATWDPEGLLSTIPAISTTLLGLLTGVASDLKQLLDATEPVDDEKLAQAVLLFTKIKRNLAEVN